MNLHWLTSSGSHQSVVVVVGCGGRLGGARRYGAHTGRKGAGAFRVATRTACCIKKAASVWLHHPSCLVTRSYTCSMCSRQPSASGLASANRSTQTDVVTHYWIRPPTSQINLGLSPPPPHGMAACTGPIRVASARADGCALPTARHLVIMFLLLLLSLSSNKYY